MRYYKLAKEITEVRSVTKYKLYEGDRLLLKLHLPFSLEMVDQDVALYTLGNYGDDIDKRRDVLFDLQNGKVISDAFNKIYPFTEYGDIKLARADIYVKYKDKVITVSCLIDTWGNIVSKVIDDHDLNPFDKVFLDKHINYLKESLRVGEEQFNDLLQNETDKATKLVLRKTV